jgi:hypothetical protein
MSANIIYDMATGRIIEAGFCEIGVKAGQGNLPAERIPPDIKYWLVDQGMLRPMTALEKQAAIDAEADRELDIRNLPPVLKKAFLLILDQFNVLREKAGLAKVTEEQFVNAIKARA